MVSDDDRFFQTFDFWGFCVESCREHASQAWDVVFIGEGFIVCVEFYGVAFWNGGKTYREGGCVETLIVSACDP